MITGDKVRLRAVEKSDLPKICQWLNDEEVMYYWGDPGNTTSLAEVERWFNQELERSRQDRKTYIIETLDGVAIGRIMYARLSLKDRSAEVDAVQIGEKDYWDKGYGTDAVMTLLKYLFNELQLHRAYIGTESYNKRAQRCYEKCGFVKEGVFREGTFVKGKYYDSITMGILSHEFDQLLASRTSDMGEDRDQR
jgi:RimJ/RimL family protein N-acetyltransferase